MAFGQNPAPFTSNRTLAKGWGVGSLILFIRVRGPATPYSTCGCAMVTKRMRGSREGSFIIVVFVGIPPIGSLIATTATSDGRVIIFYSYFTRTRIQGTRGSKGPG